MCSFAAFCCVCTFFSSPVCDVSFYGAFSAAPWPSLVLSYSATDGDIANWFTVTTSESTFDILVLADESLQLDEWIWTETGFISRALSCLCFLSNSTNIFLSSSATEGILLLQAIRRVVISFWSANFPPGVLGEYFSGNALGKRCVTAKAKAEILLDWNASRFFYPCSLFQFHEWLSLVRVSSSLCLQNAHQGLIQTSATSFQKLVRIKKIKKTRKPCQKVPTARCQFLSGASCSKPD